jgi:Icc-related predicted phosphoesterase
VPPGDILVHAGDLTSRGTLCQLEDAFRWLAGLAPRFQAVVVVAGNHDFPFELTPAQARALVPSGVTYLEGGATEMAGLRVWGGPWSPLFAGWAFEANPQAMVQHWAAIPDDVELLVTHTPAAGTLDLGPRGPAGCPALTRRIAELGHLRLHVHGHIHEAHGEALTRLGQTGW